MAKHGWYMKGLDNEGGAWNASASTELKARAPAYTLSRFEEQVHGNGLGLHEFSGFAATFEDLIHTEATGQLEWIYRAMVLSMVD